MKVKLLETVQGAGIYGTLLKSGTAVNTLDPGGEYEVDDSLGAWLLENRKAIESDKQPIHYGGHVTREPELRHDEELHEQMTKDAEPAEEESEESAAEDGEEKITDETGIEQPIMTTENQATAKKIRTKQGKK